MTIETYEDQANAQTVYVIKIPMEVMVHVPDSILNRIQLLMKRNKITTTLLALAGLAAWHESQYYKKSKIEELMKGEE